MTIGEKLRNLRLKTKKTLKEQGQIFKVSLNTIYRWEHDLAFPRRAVLERISHYYDVPMDWLLHNSGDDYSPEYQTGGLRLDNNIEQQFLSMFRKLSNPSKYKIVGYLERIYVEDVDDQIARVAGE